MLLKTWIMLDKTGHILWFSVVPTCSVVLGGDWIFIFGVNLSFRIINQIGSVRSTHTFPSLIILPLNLLLDSKSTLQFDSLLVLNIIWHDLCRIATINTLMSTSEVLLFIWFGVQSNGFQGLNILSYKSKSLAMKDSNVSCGITSSATSTIVLAGSTTIFSTTSPSPVQTSSSGAFVNASPPLK